MSDVTQNIKQRYFKILKMDMPELIKRNNKFLLWKNRFTIFVYRI